MPEPLRTDALTERMARAGGVIRLDRPVRTGERPPDGPTTFSLSYVRSGEPGGTPLLVLPGGPGIASVLPYRGFRHAAAAKGFDVVMVEHRGVGLSRTDRSGVDLPADALTCSAVVDDLAAVLDACQLDRVIVYGTSYGGYLAQALGARYPERVRGMVLDSTNSAASDHEVARDHLRRLLWRGEELGTAAIAARLRALVASGIVAADDIGLAVPTAYELGGVRLLGQVLDAAEDGRRQVWRRLIQLGDRELTMPRRYVIEFDLVGALNFRELYAQRPDGEPLDPAVGYAEVAALYPAFRGDPFPLVEAQRDFRWPTAVLSGARDMRSPRPIARGIAERVPGAVLVPFDQLAHSVLDNHPRAALHIAHSVAEGTHADLPGRASRLERLPRPLNRRVVPAGLTAALTLGWLQPH